ncbi:MAG: alanine--tRNA ligase [Firmicutes bacterium]|nr:alanine--tRNA ligase [Bacillota bacterium]
MKSLTAQELREEFLGFFQEKGHKVLPSASLIPRDDPTLLLTGAGMVPFKPYFLGTAKPPRNRITTCQRCLRTADIDNVGKTARHCTFFEMLGNFSFGDYFKEDAISWAWEFVTEHLRLPAEKLWVSIYLDDDEAFRIWNEKIGIPEQRIVRLGKEDNFWEIGVGPCGPCSEIYVDRWPDFGCSKPGCGFGCDCDRFMEIWNLVFIQFHKDEAGNYTPLPKKSIDTGMGLERACSILQGVGTVFETDVMRYVVSRVSELSGKPYGGGELSDRSIRVITDHIRGVTFLLSDGVIPSNEGRGYVLRRLLRRAARHGRLLGIDRPFLRDVADAVIAKMRDAYPELESRREHILKMLGAEEDRFRATLDQGMEILSDMMKRAKLEGSGVLPGEDVFRLYDTYGFPLELTSEIAGESGLKLDEDGFQRAMEEQRERARRARQETGYLGSVTAGVEALAGVATSFVGYDRDEVEAVVSGIFVNEGPAEEICEGERGDIILTQTPFYAEGGGQVGDTGILEVRGGDGAVAVGEEARVEARGQDDGTGDGTGARTGLARVLNTRKLGGAVISHEVEVTRGRIRKGARVLAKIDRERRLAIARNHTATHLLQAALRRVLGEHVHQAGSLVADGRLRFDFSHPEALTPEELRRVEDLVNEAILQDMPVEVLEVGQEEARAKGALALFGEKYGDVVRVIKIGDFSMELCGGTHLRRTGEAGLFLIAGEGAVAAGTRRIEATTGRASIEAVRAQAGAMRAIAERLKASPEDAVEKLDRFMAASRETERELSQLRMESLASKAADMAGRAEEINGARVLVDSIDGLDAEGLRNLGDMLRDRLGTAAVIVGSRVDGRLSFIALVAPELVARGLHAGQLVKEAARLTGGGGGGRPEMAQAGGKDVEKLGEALAQVREAIRSKLASQLH